MTKEPLKVGDRVAVYGWLGNERGFASGEIGDVTHASLEEVKVELDDIVNDDPYVLHPKQCRRLKKKARREWWISKETGEVTSARNGEPVAPHRWYHVREVKP